MQFANCRFVFCWILAFTVVASTNAKAQYGQSPRGSQSANAQGARQAPTQQTITPQQRAAMQQAAQRAYEQQQAQQNAQPQLPEGFPLTQDHQAYVEKLLDHWEGRSQIIQKYKCNFRRFSYDNGIVEWRDASNRLAAHRIAFGEIRFAAPDRAAYETSTIMKFARPPQNPGEQAKYDKVDDEGARERWICDGRSIHEFDYVNKTLYETPIPKSMQGNIIESPLPFLFGAKKKEILKRYWVRTATPKGVENEYWLVAYPKRVEDARLYSKVEIILSNKDFLPKAMHMYSPQYNPKQNNEESYYFTFENREINDRLTMIQDFLGVFVKPKKPMGWKKVVNQQRQAANAPELGAENSRPRR